MRKYSLVEHRMVLPYDTIEGQNVVTGNLSYLSLFLFCLSKRLLRRELIQISVFVSLYELRHTQIVNSTQTTAVSAVYTSAKYLLVAYIIMHWVAIWVPSSSNACPLLA